MDIARAAGNRRLSDSAITAPTDLFLPPFQSPTAHFKFPRSPHLLPSLQMPFSPILAILLFALLSLAWIEPPRAVATH